MPRSGKLTTEDHETMTQFLEDVLNAHKAGDVTRDEAVGGLAHVMAALDIGNTAEAVNWFKHGVEFVKG